MNSIECDEIYWPCVYLVMDVMLEFTVNQRDIVLIQI